jgi:hypothetical protein
MKQRNTFHSSTISNLVKGTFLVCKNNGKKQIVNTDTFLEQTLSPILGANLLH